MKHGISIPNMAAPAALVGLAESAEAAGWDGVFLWDHVQWVRSAGNDTHDPWVLLGAMAVRTERVVLGTLVTPVGRRRPAKLAKEVVTLDHLSAGRSVLGVGLGAPDEDEFAAFGEEADPRRRAGLLDEGLEVIDALLRGEPVEHHGRHFDLDVDLRPAAVQRPRPPIWVAGIWPHRRPLARAARWDGVVPIASGQGFLSPGELAEIVAACGGPRPGFDVVATVPPDPDVRALEDAGVTWSILSTWPFGAWFDDFAAAVAGGPPG